MFRDVMKSLLQLDCIFFMLGTTVTMTSFCCPSYFKSVLLMCCTITNVVLVYHMWWEHRTYGDEASMDTVSSLMLCLCLMAMFYVVVLMQDFKVEGELTLEEYENEFGPLQMSVQ